MADPNGKIIIKPDEIMLKHSAWAGGEAADASNAATRREAIGSFAEKNGIENKALSQFRSGLKIKNDGKRKDWLRSLQLLLPVAEAEIFGNEPDMFTGPETEPDDEPEQDDVEPEPDVETLIKDGDPDLAADAADFNAQADGVVTPIDFRGARA